MSNVSRYVMVQAVKVDGNELIPIWDERLKYQYFEDYGSSLKFDNKYGDITYFVDAVYDLEHRTLSSGVELNYYPDKLDFSINEDVYRETDGRRMIKDKVVDIIYENFDMAIYKGSEIESYWLKYFKDVEIITNKLYCIKQWRAKYILESGFKTEYTHQLYHI